MENKYTVLYTSTCMLLLISTLQWDFKSQFIYMCINTHVYQRIIQTKKISNIFFKMNSLIKCSKVLILNKLEILLAG